MRRRIAPLMLVVAALLVALAAPSRAVDVPVVGVHPSSLPFDLSPSNFDNSPNNFDNALSNPENAPDSFENAESNPENGLLNVANGATGTRRLLFSDGGAPRVVGYYTLTKTGVTNIFSLQGHRLFYVPKKGRGVFDARNGRYCGVLANIRGVFSLGLTDRGMKRLLLAP